MAKLRLRMLQSYTDTNTQAGNWGQPPAANEDDCFKDPVITTTEEANATKETQADSQITVLEAITREPCDADSQRAIEQSIVNTRRIDGPSGTTQADFASSSDPTTSNTANTTLFT